MTATRKLKFLNYVATAASYVGEVGSLFFDPATTTLRIGDGVTPGGSIIDATGATGPIGPTGPTGSAGVTGPTGPGGGSSLPLISVSYSGQAVTADDLIGGIPGASISWFAGGAADVLYTVTSGTTVTATGAAFLWDGAPVMAVGAAGTGANGVRALVSSTNVPFVALVYATNSSGTAYAVPAAGSSRTLCLAKGTSVALSDGTHKLIEDISYADTLLVWDFDHGCFAESRPLWIKRGERAQEINILGFSDDSYLYTVGQHRIFNKEAGCFTYPLTDATPVGTTTFNQYGHEVTLVEKGVVHAETDHYNIITDYHLNLFANGILTSTSFNNIYPITNMKFVKDDRAMRQDKFLSVADRFYYGMRLWEQMGDAADIERYIHRMISTEMHKAPDPQIKGFGTYMRIDA